MNESMNDPDPTETYQAGIRLSRDAGSYGGRVEVSVPSIEFPELNGSLQVTVHTGAGTAHASQELTPGQMRELAGALNRAADHADVVRREAQRKAEVAA